jgi:hypothetical protein
VRRWVGLGRGGLVGGVRGDLVSWMGGTYGLPSRGRWLALGCGVGGLE